MALELETKIMAEIGLHANFNWFNGSESCRYVRQEAVKRLPEVIRKYHDADPRQIALPDAALMNILTRVSVEGDTRDTTLTKTWQAASYVIAAHIHQANAAENQRQEAYHELEGYLETNYIQTPSRAEHDIRDLIHSEP
jgi:hypothetical protein